MIREHMTRKKAKKLLMSCGFDRNSAEYLMRRKPEGVTNAQAGFLAHMERLGTLQHRAEHLGVAPEEYYREGYAVIHHRGKSGKMEWRRKK